MGAFLEIHRQMNMQVIIILLFIAVSAIAGEQEPIGSKTSFSFNHTNNTIVFTNQTSGKMWTNNFTPAISLPHAYKDPESGIIIYVESDGRHISAINPDGKIFWSRDPFADAHLEFYRTRTPRINYVGKAWPQDEDHWAKKGVKKVIGITYNSSQFGFLDLKTGDFTFGGNR